MIKIECSPRRAPDAPHHPPAHYCRGFQLLRMAPELIAGRVRAVVRRGLAYCSRALLKAALASKRVESRVGRGVSSARTIKGISVQRRTPASHPRSFNWPATSLKYSREV